MLVPPYDTAATLLRLQAVIDHYRPKIVVSLGDSFHDGEGAARLPDRMRLDLSALMAGRDWFWVAGNHDPQSAGRPARRHGRGARGRLADLPPRAVGRRRRARSPGTCIPARASCSAAARCAAAASPPTASASSCRPSAPIPVRSTCSTAPMPGCSARRADGLHDRRQPHLRHLRRDAEAGLTRPLSSFRGRERTRNDGVL